MSESFPLSFWPVGDAIVVSDLPPLLNAQDLVEIDAGIGVKAEPSPAGSTASRVLWAGQIEGWDKSRRDIGEASSKLKSRESNPPHVCKDLRHFIAENQKSS
jgi:hypothetical protein